jgi:hypothetical protein
MRRSERAQYVIISSGHVVGDGLVGALRLQLGDVRGKPRLN